ncbi:MAG: hypothetical protein IH624_11875 [Phycisphaerae bacterium]|nr:hypothetical protein [Phycisphaerae bacterium]
MKRKAFTIVELLLGISLLTVLLVVSGVVFQMAVKSYRTAAATGEVARKLRAVTNQLNTDFRGLRKDGQIFIAWVPALDPADPGFTGYKRFDRITFFADGNFNSYNEQAIYQQTTGKLVSGPVARITYMLANDGVTRPGAPANQPQVQAPSRRVLARSQHIFTGDSQLVDVDPADPAKCRIRWINPANIRGQIAAPPVAGQVDESGAFTQANNNYYEYDNLTLDEWLNVSAGDKLRMLTVISGIPMSFPPVAGGIAVNTQTKPPINIHQLLAEGVGSFSVQGWYEPLDAAQGPARWFPQVDPDGNGNFSDSDFHLTAGNPPQIDTSFPPRLIYPWPWDVDPGVGLINLGRTAVNNYPRDRINRDNFNRIPGLGRALKFTFTLYDSRGVFKDGKTFTHIVYLDD